MMHPNPQKMFENRIEGKTYCTFGQHCKSGSTCDKVVTKEITERVANEPLCMFVAPPKDCFKPYDG